MDIYLIRHGKTEGNLQGRYIGSTDEPLCEEGKRALFSMKEQKKYPYPEYLFQSPMKRCKESAEILFPQKEACTVSNLRECDFGRFEGKNYLELSEDADYQRWLDSNGTLPFPAGEEQTEFRRRCVRAFCEIVEDLRKKHAASAAIVAHGGTIMSILECLAVPKAPFYNWQVGNAMGYHIALFEELWKKEKRITVIEKIEDDRKEQE